MQGSPYVTPTRSMSDGSLTVSSHKDALSAIAREVQRFQTESTASNCEPDHTEEILQRICYLKADLKKKDNLIRKLKKNINTACVVAKTALDTKEAETKSIAQHLYSVRNEASYMNNNSTKQDEQLHKLKLENDLLNERLDKYYNLIYLGYEELQRIRNLPIEDIPISEQLKEILVACGQYYANYCNECNKRTQLEQKNRFLTNKIKLLENISDNKPGNKKNHHGPFQRDIKCFRNTIDLKSSSENELTKKHQSESQRSPRKHKKGQSARTSLDFSKHLKLVNNLLQDQNHMLEDLKSISDVIEKLDVY